MARRKKGSSRRYFILRDSRSREFGVFTGRSPRQAALKVANTGVVDIILRERGTKKLHKYKGSRMKITAPDDRPSWMPAQVWKPNVRKNGIEKIRSVRGK